MNHRVNPREKRIDKSDEQRQRATKAEKPEMDLTRAQDELFDSEEAFDAIFNQLKEGIVVLDLSGRIIKVNRRVLEASGYSEEEIVGKRFKFLKMFSRTSAAEIMSVFMMILSGQQMPPFRAEYHIKTGEKMHLEITAHLFSKRGKAAGVTVTLRDITEREKTGEKLRGQALIFENLHDAIIITDRENRIIDWNPAAERMLGYRKDEILGKTIGLITTRVVFATLSDNRWSGEIDFTRKDGSVGICEAFIMPLRDEDDNIIVTAGVYREITERRRAEEARRESEERYRTLVEDSRDAVYISARDGTFVDANQAALALFGYTREEMSLVKAQQLYENPLDVQRFQKEIEREGSVRDYEVRFRKKDGAEMDCLLTVSVRRGSDGTILQYQGIIRDITERKRTEKELQRSLNKLRKSVESISSSLSSALELRDPYTAGHQRRMTRLACAIATALGLANDQAEGLRIAGSLHDIGKISVPAEILIKPGKLTDNEFSMIKNHPLAGHDILKNIDFPWSVALMVLQHHERMNGSGYPHGLKNGEIMLEARILAVADVVEVMASHRPYRPALGIDKALEEIARNRGVLYDPDVVDVCMKLFKEEGFKFEG